MDDKQLKLFDEFLEKHRELARFYIFECGDPPKTESESLLEIDTGLAIIREKLI